MRRKAGIKSLVLVLECPVSASFLFIIYLAYGILLLVTSVDLDMIEGTTVST